MSHPSSKAIIGIYQRHAHEWDKIRQRYFGERNWLDRFLALLPEHSAILDIGCGCSAPNGAYFMTYCHRMTGIDASPPLTARCRSGSSFSMLSGKRDQMLHKRLWVGNKRRMGSLRHHH